jgi:hypothetical protein
MNKKIRLNKLEGLRALLAELERLDRLGLTVYELEKAEAEKRGLKVEVKKGEVNHE